ncbi:phosphate/phosphite/phosphonate ABC transporter substrate-binding protein [Aetokthonos hydrillicola]|uniref:phosphate/phosphite/phosphonate ABC transporter substrate-binding protein n=1 Tax=Aetokthonos hydrillicola TaxID=1550245 RepID=UPI001ABB3046
MVLSQKGLLGASAALLAFTGLAVNVFSGMQAVANPNSRQQRQTLVAQREGEITMVFSSRADSTDLQNKANAVAAFLSKETGMKINAQIGDDTAAVEALRANRADVAFLSTRPALKAEKLAGARFYLAEVRENYSGKHTYNSVFVVPANSPLTTQPTAKATLEQLRGKKIAFTSPTSGSGFIFPTSELVKLGLVPNRDGLENLFGRGNVTYGGNYSKALQAVLRNQAEVATVSEYAMFPPYITNQERQKLRVLYKIPGVPAHGIAIDDDLPPQVRSVSNCLLVDLTSTWRR